MVAEQGNAIATIRSLYPSLFDVEKKIADYLISNPETVVNMTVAMLAKETGAAESSIVRFCQRVGFDGYTRLKINIARNLKAAEGFLPEDIQHTDPPKTVTAKVFASSIKALGETLDMLDGEQLERAVEALLRAKRFEFYGVGTSANLALDAYYRFMRIGLPASAAVDPHIMRISAAMLDKDCTAVGISHTGRTKDTVRALEIARDRGAETICITSYAKSAITQVAAIQLITATPETRVMKEAVSSRIAHIALLDSLYACAVLRKYDLALENLENMTEMLNETRY